MKDLEGKVVYFMGKVVGEKVKKEEEKERQSNQQLREMLGTESIKKDDTKEKIAVSRSQCEKRGERLYVEGHETRDRG